MLGGDLKMAATCHSYSLRSRRASTIRPAAASVSDSASVLSASRTADSCSTVAIVRGRRQRASESSRDIEKKIVWKDDVDQRRGGPLVNRNLQTTSVKVKKVLKRGRRVSDPLTELDIEDAPAQAPIYTFAKEEAATIRSSLLSWYDEHHRILPWRQNVHSRHDQDLNDESLKLIHHVDTEEGGISMKGESDGTSCAVELLGLECGKVAGTKGIPSELVEFADADALDTELRESPPKDEQRAYEVWVSEVMLQQTRVSTVIDYYQRWMERWPTLHQFAQASLEEVNTVWAGLGYYRRARFLLEGAKQIVENCSGFPRSLKELLQVPGIGMYTAGAIASIAFQQPVPLVDGNVIRVLSRLRAISESPKLSSTGKIHWALAKELVDARRPGDLNQSLMELGATVCTPTSPSCSSCPISGQCKALSWQSRSVDKVVTDFPLKVAKVPPRDEYVATCILVVQKGRTLEDHFEADLGNTDSHTLLVQRPKQGLLAGLWEFPLVSLRGGGVLAREQRAAMDRYLADSLGFNISKTGDFDVVTREPVGTYSHIFSHIKMHMSIEWLLLCPSDGSEWQLKSMESKRASVSMKWVQCDAVDKLGLTSSVKRIYSMYLNHMKLRRQRETLKSKRLKS